VPDPDPDQGDLELAERAWDEYWAATRPRRADPAVEQHAVQLAREHALCGTDAIHIASALPSETPSWRGGLIGPRRESKRSRTATTADQFPAARSARRRISAPAPTQVARKVDNLGDNKCRYQQGATDGLNQIEALRVVIVGWVDVAIQGAGHRRGGLWLDLRPKDLFNPVQRPAARSRLGVRTTPRCASIASRG
jgi:hypothetical protein